MYVSGFGLYLGNANLAKGFLPRIFNSSRHAEFNHKELEERFNISQSLSSWSGFHYALRDCQNPDG